MNMNHLFSFFLTSLIIILLPGTGVIYTISLGLSHGKEASIHAALGCTLGILPHLFISIMLSSLLFSMNQAAFFFIKLLGCAYLFYLGIGMLFGKNTDLEIQNIKKAQKIEILRRGICINLLNPKLTLFFFAFLPQYVSSTTGHYLLQCWLFGISFMLLTFLIFCLYGICAGAFQTKIAANKNLFGILQKTFGMIFIAFALQLILPALLSYL